jgi:type IV pilus assembly protein PilY1
MKSTSRPRKTFSGFLGRLLSVSLAVWVIGAVNVPAMAQVPVSQGPLTVQKPIPPNIVLMLDDSGSMAWDVMPDWGYLSSTSEEALIDADVNRVYYNPTVDYTAPVAANGGNYPDASFDAALVDGFDATSNKVDLATYSGKYDTSRSGRSSSDVQYSTTVSNNSKSYSANACPSYSNKSTKHKGYCYFRPPDGHPYDFYDKDNKYYYSYRCNSSNDAYNNGKCIPTYSFFTYTTTNTSGGYTRHYVGADGACAAVGLSSAECEDSATARQNVANWFSYYHTRILMAKTGLMNSFSTIDPKFRVGYGSLHGNDHGSMGAREVKPVDVFGDGSSSSDRRTEFWNWLVSEYASGGTPLRAALKSMGKYYQTKQPWETMSSDPVPANTPSLACRQSYSILTTDGFWNGSNPNVGNADDKTFTIKGPNQRSYTYTPKDPFSDDQSNTLADVAMEYWGTDLRTDIQNEVPTNNEDPAFWQHMTTFTLGLGFTPKDADGNPVNNDTVKELFQWASSGTKPKGMTWGGWPNPKSDSIHNIADLVHAAVNGRGGFYSAKTPQAFTSGLKEALKRAAERVGTGASLSANSTELKTGTVAYQANYYTGKWKGDLKALDVTGGSIAATASWHAADKLPAPAARNIMTYDSSGSTPALIAFKDPASLSAAERAALGSTKAEQVQMIDYLRGDASNEQKNSGTFRNRDTALGDIVDSQPVYVGAPAANQFYNESFTGSDSYSTFASNKNNRTPLIYVAANDGMLHAFDASTGVETFAYLPAAVITQGISELADPDYGTTTAIEHKFFNDGEMTVADAYFGSAWHSVLVGTTGRGLARAVYALDVTNPASIKLLWERSASDGKLNSKYIGQMTGKPVIAQTASGTWSVLMGNGYNSTSGEAALLQFDLTDGDLTVHATDTTGNNGLAAPVVWIDSPSNGISTTAYAGDLQGRVWSFDLSSSSSTGTKLFTTSDGSNPQPITAGMLAGKDPDTGNVWLFFGTGRYLDSGDLADTQVQSWYGLIVQSPADPTLVSNLASKGRSALVQREILAQTLGDPGASPPVLPARAITATQNPSDLAGKSGWYLNLQAPGATGPVSEGERMVTPSQFQGNLLLGTTRIPKATDPCNPSGTGWIMSVNPFTGTAPDKSFFDINGNGSFNDDTITVNGKTYAAAGVGFSSLPNNPIFVGSTMLVSFDNGSNTGMGTPPLTGNAKRVSWRELINQ